MNEISPGRLRLAVKEAEEISVQALLRLGYGQHDAKLIADHVIDAALCGYEYSGLAKILNIPEDPRFKDPRQPCKIIRETPVSALVDGGNNVGMVALPYAIEAAIRIAGTSGIALVGVTRAWMSGRLGYYTEKLARAGLVGMHIESTRGKTVAPPGGAKSVLGTNPISFGIPTDGEPLVLDMGTAAIVSTDVAYRARTGKPLPEGVAINELGEITRNASEALKGSLLTFGGHKGFGLSLVVQMLGTMAGAAFLVERPFGAILIAFRPDLLSPADRFREEAGNVIRRVKGVERRRGVDEIRIPFERALETRRKLCQEGIVIDKQVYDALRAF